VPRYAFKGQFYFATPQAQNQFATAFVPPAPGEPATVNVSTDAHGTTFQLVRANALTRAGLDTIFSAAKTQAINRGAVAPSFMWLKEVADGGVELADSVYAAATAWTDVKPSPV
jgi:hypothetical protein